MTLHGRDLEDGGVDVGVLRVVGVKPVDVVDVTKVNASLFRGVKMERVVVRLLTDLARALAGALRGHVSAETAEAALFAL